MLPSAPPLTLLLLPTVGAVEECVILYTVCSETPRQLIHGKKCSSPCEILECCAEQNRGWFFSHIPETKLLPSDSNRTPEIKEQALRLSPDSTLLPNPQV